MSGLYSNLVTGLHSNGQGSNKHVFCDVSWKWLCSIIEAGFCKYQVYLKVVCNLLSVAASLNNTEVKFTYSAATRDTKKKQNKIQAPSLYVCAFPDKSLGLFSPLCLDFVYLIGFLICRHN